MFHDSIMSDLEAELECELSSFSNSGKLKYNSLPRKPLHGLYSPLPPSQKVAADSVAAAAPAESAKMKAAELIKGQPVKSSVAPKGLLLPGAFSEVALWGLDRVEHGQALHEAYS